MTRGEIDPTLQPVSERIERTDDIVAIDTEIEGKVVARPRRDADVRNVVLRRHRRDERLRSVAAGNTDRVRTSRHGSRRDAEQIVAVPEHDRFDSPRGAFADEAEALSLPAAGRG